MMSKSSDELLSDKAAVKSPEIRAAFLEYFRSKDHRIVPSAPLIPKHDPTLLFVNAGMVQFKSIFLGDEKSPHRRATSCQKCMRAGGKHSDLENVGHTARHHTFFEMLGNFSFGDYFKKDAMLFAWEFLTEWFKLPKEKLYVSVYEEDDEAAGLWSKVIGLPDNRIVKLGAKDNFWQMGDTGPCGPCSEIIIDQGETFGCGKPDCRVGCDCDRYLELWNLVFMQYNRDESGNLTPLPTPSIDTGMGLERLAAVLQHKKTNFDTDLFSPVIQAISSIAEIEYGASHDHDISMRVIADHIRATVFILSEGLVPSNEGRGYVLRRIIRRAARHAKLLNIHEPCLYRLIDSVIEVMANIYPEIVREQSRTKKLLKIEEESFHRTIDTGMNRLDDIMETVKQDGLGIIPGKMLFELYDTFGFPLDFARDIAMDAGLKIDEDAFQKEMQLQRERSKGNVVAGNIIMRDWKVKSYVDVSRSEFVGYDTLTASAVVNYLYKNNKVIDVLEEGEEGEIVLDITPFYGESGGQAGDTGIMTTKHALIRVTDTKKPDPDVYIHRVNIEKGSIKKGDQVFCTVDETSRKATMRNHTATHLLHKALRMVIGEHVKQSGSAVDPERLRFDFTHFKAIQDDEIKQIEDIINEKVIENLPVKTDTMSLDEATKTGATALFDEKYGETVRVISVGDFSKELCGGTHCKATGEIGLCVILSESSVASGIRRIEALTGKPALDYLKQKKSEAEQMRSILKTDRPLEKVGKLLDEMKSMEKEIQRLKTSSARDVISDALKDAHELGGIKVVRMRQDGLNTNELRLLADNVRDRLGSGIVVVSSVTDSQAAIVCMVTKDLTDRYNAGKIVSSISKIAGGRGGGKPDMAQGGTKDIAKLDEALQSLYDIIKK